MPRITNLNAAIAEEMESFRRAYEQIVARLHVGETGPKRSSKRNLNVTQGLEALDLAEKMVRHG